nr:hypothetical protein AOJQRVMU_AOJQRVMU_CDS_0004 [Microvirus sp.]
MLAFGNIAKWDSTLRFNGHHLTLSKLRISRNGSRLSNRARNGSRTPSNISPNTPIIVILSSFLSRQSIELRLGIGDVVNNVCGIAGKIGKVSITGRLFCQYRGITMGQTVKHIGNVGIRLMSINILLQVFSTNLHKMGSLAIKTGFENRLYGFARFRSDGTGLKVGGLRLVWPSHSLSNTSSSRW